MRTYLTWIVRLMIGFATASVALAWSSKSFLPCEPIHQMAIQNVLSNQVSPNLIKILQDEQIVVDRDQQATNSFEHSMTGLASASEKTNIQRPIYIAETEDFIHTNLAAAIRELQAGLTNAAYTNLGKAIHPLEDATSPAHLPFQAWKFNESLWEEIKHVCKEYAYPRDETDTNQVAERIQLQGAVQYAYDIATGKTNMPAQFFNHTNGLLELPPAYLRSK